LHALALEAVQQIISLVPELQTESDDLPATFHARSEGNPLFLHELVAEVIESRRRSPRAARTHEVPHSPAPASSIDSIIGARVSGLSPSARSVAEVAAVAGQGFNIDVVREVSGWEENDVLAALDELIGRHIVKEVGRGHRFDHAFTHHLIQSAIYDDIPPDVRMRRHRRIAGVFADLYPHRSADMALELARHHERGSGATSSILNGHPAGIRAS
jgi:predicted ATPase